jgi:hypothetical protein
VDATLLGEPLQTRTRAPLNLAVARSEFARFVHLAREACNIKLGPRNAMLSVFWHVRVFTRVHPKVTFCKSQRHVLDVAQSCDAHATLSSTATPHARLRRRKRSSRLARRVRPRNAPVNVQVQRCEHDAIARAAPSGALLPPRRWHPVPIMLHSARKADSPVPANIQKGETAHTRPWARRGPCVRPRRASGKLAPTSRPWRQKHECN